MKRVISFTIIFIVATCFSTSATIINVPGEYPTIQAGINAAGAGDTVLVAPGIYYENVQMAEGVNLIGSGMENTTIDGQGLNDVIKALSVNNFLIEGFTIQNSQQGGGSPGNIGVFINPISSSGTKIVRYCRVRNNGKGIDLWNDFGGVLYVEHNIISDNIYDGFDPYLGTVYLTNNTIVENGRDGYHDWSGGGAMYLKNNIFAENGRYGIFKHRTTPVYISYNDVWNNAEGAYYEGYSGNPTPFVPYPGTGEIAEDPLFVNPNEDDFHLQVGSPCIDAGDPSLPFDPDGTIADMGALYFHQWIIIGMDPDNPPVSVHPGGSFQYAGTLQNNTGNQVSGDVWIMIGLPAGGFYGPVRRYNNIPLAPGQNIEVLGITQNVPVNAPLGLYEYIAYCGRYPSVIINQASFEFEVVAPAGGTAYSWSLFGWFDDTRDQTPAIPTELGLSTNYPNPFNAVTTISYDLPATGHVRLDIYNLTGQMVETLTDGHMEAGHHSVQWDASSYSSGIYFYRLTVADQVFTERMTLLK
jgi:hypothetical protein